MIELNLKALSPPWSWSWYHVAQSPQLTNHMILNHVINSLSGMTSPYREPLHFWDKSPLVMVCSLFSVLLDSISLYFFFFEDFCIIIHKGYSL